MKKTLERKSEKTTIKSCKQTQVKKYSVERVY